MELHGIEKALAGARAAPHRGRARATAAHTAAQHSHTEHTTIALRERTHQ